MKEHLEKEWRFYLKRKKELVQKYLGKYVVIYKNSVRGAFDNDDEAIDYAFNNGFKPNHFLVQKVLEKEPVDVILPMI